MKSLGSWINEEDRLADQYRALELIDAAGYVDEDASRAPHKNWLRAFGEQVLELFVSSDEPVISQTLDSDGHLWWTVYNPHTQQTIWFDTEREVLEWLDRYPYL